MRRSRSVLTRRRATALVLVLAGAALGTGVMHSASGVDAAVPPTGTPHTAHTPSVSHARGTNVPGGTGTSSPGAGTRTGSAAHTPGVSHARGATLSPGVGTRTPGVGAHTPSPSHGAGAAPAPGTPALTGGSPTADNRYVQHLYTDLIGGQDPSGEAYWSSQLAGGSSRWAVALPLTQTDSYRSLVVTALYQQVMRRAVDGPGLAFWTGQMGAGLTPERLAAGLTGSTEWFHNPQLGNGQVDTFISAVYMTMLGRAPDASGAAYWHDFLMTGGPAWQLTLDFAYSPEWAGQTVTRMFNQYHLGTPDAAGLGYWQGRVLNGLPDDQLAASLVASDAYYGWAQTH